MSSVEVLFSYVWFYMYKDYDVIISHRIHVWYIYLHDWVIYGVNVGKYSIHGSCGYGNPLLVVDHHIFFLVIRRTGRTTFRPELLVADGVASQFDGSNHIATLVLPSLQMEYPQLDECNDHFFDTWQGLC